MSSPDNWWLSKTVTALRGSLSKWLLDQLVTWTFCPNCHMAFSTRLSRGSSGHTVTWVCLSRWGCLTSYWCLWDWCSPLSKTDSLDCCHLRYFHGWLGCDHNLKQISNCYIFFKFKMLIQYKPGSKKALFKSDIDYWTGTIKILGGEQQTTTTQIDNPSSSGALYGLGGRCGVRTLQRANSLVEKKKSQDIMGLRGCL